jgi:hypothetical protein
MLSVSTRTLRRYIADGHVPVCRLPSGRVRIRAAAIVALMGEEEPCAHRGRSDAAKPRAGLAASTSVRGRRLPLGREQSSTLLFDTSPSALAAARESA